MLHDGLPPVIRDLLRPAAHPAPVARIDVIQTHVSYLLLAGDDVYKVKKPLDLGFLDFTTLERREHFCRHEVELNRRLCPDVYRGVVPITLVDGQAVIGGVGPVVEWAVWMRRLPAERMLPALLRADAVTPADMASVATRLAAFHASAATGEPIDRFGLPAAIRANSDENFRQLRRFVGRTLEAGHAAWLRGYLDTALQRQEPLLLERVRHGRIRDCHGDVHAGSICLADSVLIFDCIEFNDRFRYGDVAAEVAFLAMDLDHYGRADLGWHFVDAYRRASGDDGLPALLDFYKCYRAMVRGKVESFRSEQASVLPVDQAAAAAAAREYFDLAFTYAGGVARPGLIITSGLMGSGKTTLGQALARRLSLVYLSSDMARKRLAGLGPGAEQRVAYGAGIYDRSWSERTYAELLQQAYAWLGRGCSVIVDASFARRTDRERARALARSLDVPCLALECQCPAEVARARLTARATAGEPWSDGRLELYERQAADFEPYGADEAETRLVVATSEPLDVSATRVRDWLALAQSRIVCETIPRLSDRADNAAQA